MMDGDCDDGLSCTLGNCRDGVCDFQQLPATCVIDGACWMDDAADPGNECQLCDPARSTVDWSPRPVGTDCDDGMWCTPDDACDDAGVCTGGGVRCDDGNPCTMDACDEGTMSCGVADGCPAPQWCTDMGCRDALRVFVTSSTTDGTFGGLAAADTICQGLADTAGLGGTYQAWLSDGVDDPTTRLTRSTDGYARVDGTLVARDWAHITSTDPGGTTTLLAPINLDETGATLTCSSAWSAVAPDGVGSTNNCGGWTGGSTGSAGRFCEVSSGWTRAIGTGCTAEFHLYCFEQ